MPGLTWNVPEYLIFSSVQVETPYDSYRRNPNFYRSSSLWRNLAFSDCRACDMQTKYFIFSYNDHL